MKIVDNRIEPKVYPKYKPHGLEVGDTFMALSNAGSGIGTKPSLYLVAYDSVVSLERPMTTWTPKDVAAFAEVQKVNVKVIIEENA